MGGGIVPELRDARMALERGLHDAALHAVAAAVNQPHFAQAGGNGGVDVLLHDRRNVPRRKRVQIELGLDRNPDGLMSQLSTLNSQLSTLNSQRVDVSLSPES
jgi:hypothetical protein